MDVDVIMAWPLSKIYEHMAFYMTEQEDFIEQHKEDKMTPEHKRALLVAAMKASIGK